MTADAPSSVSPYCSPRSHPFSTSVSLWNQIGGLEALYDEGMELAEKMRHYRNAVDVYVEPYANHDIIYLGKNLGFTAEAVKVVNLQEGTSKDEGSKEKTLG